MAEQLRFKVTVAPRDGQRPATAKDGETIHDNVVMSSTNRTALDNLLNLLSAGTDVSSVVTAINALL